MNKILVIQITIFLVFAGLFGYMVSYTSVYDDIKSTIVTTTCFSCIKMDPVTHIDFTFETANGQPNPEFVVDNLTKGPVFLAFRQDVCTACDKMDPILKSVFGIDFEKKVLFYQTVSFDGSNVTFFHINLDHASGDFLNAFSIYDVDVRSGVPMFVIIALGNNSGTIQPCYATAYSLLGESQEEHRGKFLQDMVSMGINRYDENILNYMEQAKS